MQREDPALARGGMRENHEVATQGQREVREPPRGCVHLLGPRTLPLWKLGLGRRQEDHAACPSSGAKAGTTGQPLPHPSQGESLPADAPTLPRWGSWDQGTSWGPWGARGGPLGESSAEFSERSAVHRNQTGKQALRPAAGAAGLDSSNGAHCCRDGQSWRGTDVARGPQRGPAPVPPSPTHLCRVHVGLTGHRARAVYNPRVPLAVP